ncbi:facilitated trehalose transporter Tret1-like [Hyposmocoma kahamanoa]|uniref:facilitated trehalose transporter Tret1-like n=1 Tax=Hyposmocoma kahamanoa TaxID=1477025 RepID=UPI000E6D7ACB|nr:facilitated trehalose transporter Tret1-like [Hyposmocoma kahamanoa]
MASMRVWVVSGVLVNMMAQGAVVSYVFSLMPALQGPDSPVEVDLHTASWIASCVGLAAIPGFFLASAFMDRWGRKITHMLLILPGIIGWTLIYYAASVAAFLIGRILCGITVGATVILGPIVIGECSSPNLRGMFLNLKTVSVCLGSTIVHILSNYVSWRMIALLAVIPYIYALLNVMTWYETPAFLAYKKEFGKAEKSFFWLRGHDDKSKKELNELIRSQMNKVDNQKVTTFMEDIVDFFKKFTRRDFLFPILILISGTLLFEVSGRHFFPAYAVDITGEVTGNNSHSFYYILAMDLIITLSATFSSLLVKIMKRRTLLFTTGWAAVITIAITCTYLFLASKDVISRDRHWIPISLFVVYFVLVNLGCTPIPLAFFGEILPLAHRAVGSALLGVIVSCALYLVLHVTPFLLVNVKVFGTFAVFGGSMAVLLSILYFVVPETKDRTLQEIEEYFNYGRFKDDEQFEKGDEASKVVMLPETEVKL